MSMKETLCEQDIEKLASAEVGTTVYAPVPKPKKPDRDPHQPLPGDRAAIAEWRQRMGTPEAKEIYKERASTVECVNAISRNRGLNHLECNSLPGSELSGPSQESTNEGAVSCK